MKRRVLARSILGVSLLVLACFVAACGRGDSEGRLVPGELAFAARSDALGSFDLAWEGRSWEDARLRVVHRDRPDETVFATLPGRAFLEIARGPARVEGEGSDARVVDDLKERCADLTIDAIETEFYALLVSGRMRCALLDRAFELFVVPEGADELRFHVRLTDASFNRISVIHARAAGETLFGLGARASATVSGPVPLFVTPPGAGGSPAPVPHLLSTRLWAVELESPQYARVEVRPDRVRTDVSAAEVTFRLQRGASPLELVRLATAAAGRGEALPAWVQEGPIVVVRGGASEARAAVALLASRGITPAALQIEGWALPGTSLELDSARHPGWHALLSELREAGIRTLLDASPVVPTGEPGIDPLRDRADAEGLWILDAGGAPFVGSHGGVPSRWLDLSSAAVREFWAEALETKLLGIGAAGWLVRDGGTLPFGARLSEDRSAAEYHNRYADAAVRASRLAIRESEAADAIVLTETGFVHAPRHTPILLAGDAGDPASFARLLSAGLSGYVYPGLDAGGAEAGPALVRSIELAAFAPVHRIRAEALVDPAALDALARTASFRAAWAGYRGELVRQAVESGVPMLRALWLHHPDAPDATADEPRLFTIGSELLVAPVFDPGETEAEVQLPPGRFIDLFGGEIHGAPDRSVRVRLAAPAGAAVLYPEGSIVGARLRKALFPGDSE